MEIVPELDARQSQALRQRAGDFSQMLVRALMATVREGGDRPSTRASAVRDLREVLRALAADGAGELTWVDCSAIDGRGFVLEGVVPESLELARDYRNIFDDNMRAALRELFQSSQLVAVTIKRTAEESDLDALLTIWGGNAARGVGERAAPGQLGDALARRGCTGVAVLSEATLLPPKDGMSWPVRLVLSRLRAELWRLPLLRVARPDDPAQGLKAQLIGDVIRPVPDPLTLRDVLILQDLVAGGPGGVTGAELEDAIVAAISPRLLGPVGNVLIDALGKRVGDEADARRRLGKVLSRLAGAEIEGAREVFVNAHARGLVAMDDLPEEIRRVIKGAAVTERVLAGPDAYVAELEGCTDPRTYLKHLNVLAAVIPELVRRRESSVLGRLVAVLDAQARNPHPAIIGQRRFIDEALKIMERSGAAHDLVRLALNAGDADRPALEAGAALFGGAAVPALVLAISNNDDPDLRKAATRILARVGEPGVPLVIDELRAHRHSVHTTRALLQVLGDLGAREAAPVILQYAGHPHEKVREEVVVAVAKALGVEAEPDLLGFLGDKDDVVARRAIHQLGLLRSRSRVFVEKVVELIRARTRGEDEAPEPTQAACLEALARYEGVPLEGQAGLEDTLAEIVGRRGLKALLFGRMNLRAKPNDLVAMAAQALGAVGGPRSLDVLRGALEHDAEPVRAAAAAALAKMQVRLGRPS